MSLSPLRTTTLVRAHSGTAQDTLNDNVVHVWLAYPDRIAPSHAAAYSKVLSPSERARHQRFRFDRDRHLYLVAHTLVRATLSRYSDLPVQAWEFVENEYGRPAVKPGLCDSDVRFNLSHTTGMVACAVSRGRDLGVDVESTERARNLLSISRRVFALNEQRTLFAAPLEERNQLFYSYWTLKESYIKARGMGLSLALNQFAFDFEGDASISLQFDACMGDNPLHWQFALYRPTPTHLLAVGAGHTEQSPLILHVGNTVPLQD